jgi:hypothetical protein
VTTEVLALLQERQDRRKAELDAHLRDVHFAIGDAGGAVTNTEHAPLPSTSLLSQRFVGPFKVLTYCLDVPATWHVFQVPEFNVDLMCPYPAALMVQELLKFTVPDELLPPACTSALGEQQRVWQRNSRRKKVHKTKIGLGGLPHSI